jgi:hypothetical protein
MLMIIFGAGASFDSVAHLPVDPKFPEEWRPPLADNLFEDREHFVEWMTCFQQCMPVITSLRSNTEGESVEMKLKRLLDESIDYPQRKKQLTAIRYYLHCMLWMCENKWKEKHRGIENYSALLDQIEYWRVQKNESVLIVTFNYDCMIEKALFRVGVHTQFFRNYIDDHRYKLFKPHGSINWGRIIKNISRPISPVTPYFEINNIIESNNSIDLTDEFRIVYDYPMSMDRDGVLFPALAIPLETKTDFECPQDHLNVLRQEIPKVEKLITIGWRASEMHFLTMLSEGLSQPIQGLAVSGKKVQSQQTISNLTDQNITGKFIAYDGGFSEFVSSKSVENFLFH